MKMKKSFIMAMALLSGVLAAYAQSETTQTGAVPQENQISAAQLELERRIARLQQGDVEAPAFTFQDREGKDVSLSDFKGKWVIIDFWGSWCRYCIKGIPALKEAYAKYQPQVEVIGIACRDPKDIWIQALQRYELPWVNLWNPDPKGGKVLQDYSVPGFPTKVIVDPAGKIRNITIGDDPEFYVALEKLLAEGKK